MSEHQGNIDPNNPMVKGVVMNVSSELITITEDKMKFILITNKKALSKKNDWVGPLSIFISIIVIFISAEFKPAFGLKPEHWQTIFAIGLILSFLWLMITFWNIIFNSVTVEDIILKMRNEDKPSKKKK
jgi:hypothetical protein